MTAIDITIDAPAWLERLPRVEALLGETAATLDAPGEAAVLLTSDEAVRDLNGRFRGKDAATNVLSFPAVANSEGRLGDIALALGVCEAEARDQGKPLADHVRHLLVHGLLHLIGYDHEKDGEAQIMETRERELLARLGVPDPYDAGPRHSPL